MKTLLLLRGAPGCGKSTFIEQNGLKPYALSADDLRLLVRSPSQAVDGTDEIVFENEADVWNLLYKMLEIRMQSGEFTVIDATNSKTSEMNKYKEMCDMYRYRMFCIDFTDLPIEECKRRNASRPKIKRVPEDAIDKMYARFRTQKIPSGIKVLKPDQLDSVWMHKFDMSKYDKIVHIGDDHGCMAPLSRYIRTSYFGFDYDEPNYWRSHRWLNVDDLPGEIWKDVDGYDGQYLISNYGRLKTFSKLRERIYVYRQYGDKYLYANLSLHSKKKTHKAHKLVWDAFGDGSCDEINHIDGVCQNNNIKNLERSDRISNETHCWESGIKHGRHIIQFDLDHNKIKEYDSVKQAVDENGFSTNSGIIHCCNGDLEHAFGYIWEYADDISGNRSGKSVCVLQYTPDGEFVAEYPSIKAAEKAVGVQSIRNCLAGNQRTSGGFVWKTKDYEYSVKKTNPILYDPKYLTSLMNDNYFYIFVGDYTDRGIENADVVKFMMDAVERPNVLCLTGNHEKWIWLYAHDCVGKSKEFEFFTRKQLDEAQIDKKKIRKMMRKFGQAAWYTYGDKEILVTHAGIATMPDNLTLMATKQFVHGVGGYKDSEAIAKTWIETTPDNMYQIHGHRNIKNIPMKVNDRVYNLEGKVEFGGHLRILELDANGFHEIEIKNDVFCPPIEVEQHKEIADSPISDVVMKLRQNKYIQEKEFGHISSFNFTNSAFYDKVWDAQTVQARGLYIDTERMKVAARGFSKFFNINERPETKFEMLQHKFQFPVTCYVKENGFLGLISYDIGTDDLFITTKSTPEGPYAQWFREMFERKVSSENREKIKNYCKEYDVTFVFECVDLEHDPHVIDYPESNLYLLSVVKNALNFEQVSYANLCLIAEDFGLTAKTLGYEIANWSDFVDWYNMVMDKDYEFNGRIIEGFVIEDSAGFMTKCKLTYYNFWKFMRGIAHETLRRGYIPPAKTSALTTDTANKFYGFCKLLYEETPKEERDNIPKDIVTLRKMFYAGYRDLY